MNTKKIKKLLTTRTVGEKLRPEDFLHTGSTVLNLACSGKRKGGFVKGGFFYIVGDSSAGKSWMSCTCLAEAANNPSFDDYRLIINNTEDGMLMDFKRFFGKKMADRVEMKSSSTIDELYDDLDDVIKEGKPFIYVQDSMDALSSDMENEKFEEQKKARRKGREITGSYGDGKAKKNSGNLRRVMAGLKATGSILIIISQTRDNIGFGAQFDPKTRSGGRALKFYATLELWLAIRTKIKQRIKGKDRQLGIICQVKVKKNRLTGKDRTVEIPIYHSHGFDDVGGCVSYLVSEGHWKGTKDAIKAKEFNITNSEEGIVAWIEGHGRETELFKLCQTVWTNIEDACAVQRKKRYV